MDIIDIACGTGNYADYFKQFKPQSLTLIDASEGMLDEAKAKLMSPLKKPRLSFKKAILPEIPYEDNSFDVGMINMVSALSEKKNHNEVIYPNRNIVCLYKALHAMILN